MRTRTPMSPLAAALVAALVTTLLLGTMQVAFGAGDAESDSTRTVTAADFYTKIRKIPCPDGGGTCPLTMAQQQLRCNRNDLLMSGSAYVTRLSDGNTNFITSWKYVGNPAVGIDYASAGLSAGHRLTKTVVCADVG